MKWAHIYALCLRHLYPLRRDFDLLSDMIYWPIIDVYLWGITSMWIGGASGSQSVVTAILTGLVLWNVIWRSQSEIARNLLDEIWNNNLVNLFSTPITLKEWVSGVILLSIVKMLFTVVVVIAAIGLLYSINIFAIGWWILPFFISTIMTGWWVGFISAGIVIRWGQKVQTVIWTLPGVLLPLSVVYFPLANLPHYIQPISYLIPTTYIFESMRSLLQTGSLEPGYILISFALNILYLGITLVWFVKSFRASLNLGLTRFS